MSPQPPFDDWPTRVDDRATLAQTDELTRTETRRLAVPPEARAPLPPEPPRAWYDNHLAAGMLAVLVVLAAAAGAAIAYELHQGGHSGTKTAVQTTATTHKAAPTKPAMPRLVGLGQQQALTQLRRLGLSATLLRRATDKPTGTVVAQRPAQAAAVTKTTPVTLVVDAGAPKVTLPNLVGRPLSHARGTLETAGLHVQTTSVASAGNQTGTIVRQSPSAGSKLAAGAAVHLSVAAPPASTTARTAPAATATTPTTSTATAQAPPRTPRNATVPDVTGQSVDGAAHALARAGILASIAFVPSEDPLGTVEQQAKPGGTTLPYDSHVQINVSSGANASTTEPVPRVVGSTLDQAVATLNGARLRLIYVKIPVPRAQAGKIVQQSPLPGSRAPQNAQVLVFLGAYKG
jgi:serine/threonine-protein kinase